MEILISRSGGFAGLTEELARVDTRELDAERAAALRRGIAKAEFFTLPNELPSESVGTDQFTYSITVSGDQGSHTVSYLDDGTGTASAGAVAEIVDLVLEKPPE